MSSSTRRGRSFTFHECLGRGGFGEVYRATMTRGRHVDVVAVKVLHVPRDAESQPLERLRDEAAMLVRLEHPAILKVYDLVVLRGELALVSEYVDGADLEVLIQQDVLSPPAVLEIGAAVADALHFANTAPNADGTGCLALVHRDVKPANIRLGKDGSVKLLDFGMAKAAIDRDAKTNPDSVFGSYPYMAPEQIAEVATEATSAVDVYGLGATLFEALVGRRLWRGTLKDVYLNTLGDRHDPAVEERLKLVASKPLRELLRTFLFRDPSMRPTTPDAIERMRAVAAELRGHDLQTVLARVQWPPNKALEGKWIGDTIDEDFVDPASVGALRQSRPRQDTGPTVIFSEKDAVPTPPASPARTASAVAQKPSTVDWLRTHPFQVLGFLVFGFVALPALMLLGMLAAGVVMRFIG